MDKNDPNVGTGLVGAPACGDVMKLQIKVRLRPSCRVCNTVWSNSVQQLGWCRSVDARIPTQSVTTPTFELRTQRHIETATYHQGRFDAVIAEAV